MLKNTVAFLFRIIFPPFFRFPYYFPTNFPIVRVKKHRSYNLFHNQKHRSYNLFHIIPTNFPVVPMAAI